MNLKLTKIKKSRLFLLPLSPYHLLFISFSNYVAIYVFTYVEHLFIYIPFILS
jgi:hypothetical protein